MRLQWLALLLISGTLVGCRTVPVNLSILKPAVVNMNPYQNVVVDRVDGEIGGAIADEVQSQLHQQGRFTLYEREALLTRHVPRDTALITGATRSDYQERIDQSETTCYAKGYSYKCRQFTRHGTYSAGGTMRVTDVTSGQRAGEMRVGCSRSLSTQATEQNPPLIDVNGMAYSCASEIADDFVTALAPYRVNARLLFRKNGSLPMLEEGIEKARAADLKGAIALFQKATEQTKDVDPEEQADAWWNLALAYEYDNQLDAALGALQRARTLDPAEKKYDLEAENIRERQSDLEALAEQGVN